jgi:cytidylate kinase
MGKIIIAIDGPAAAGKSTVAKLVAKQLDYTYIDTGALYRAIALYIKQNNIDYNNIDELVKHLPLIHVELQEDQCYLNGQNITPFIRTGEISNLVSIISAIKEVRQYLNDIQKSYAQKKAVVMEGRDIGSKIAPEAELKIFLSASNRSRALRRQKELEERGEFIDIDVLIKDIIERDARDSTRAIAPLTKTADAILIDSSDIDANNVANLIVSLAQTRINNV